MEFHSGVNGSAKIGATEVATVGWSVDPSVDEVVFRNSKTDAYSVIETTFKQCTGTIDADFDFDANIFTDASPLTLGAELTDLKLYLDDVNDATMYWHFPIAVVLSTPQSVATEGKITTSIRFRNSGIFYPPGITP
jgi:hypothetical protein